MTQRRNLIDVIDQMLAVIPATEVRLRLGLESSKQSAAYTSPETIGLRWIDAAERLQNAIGDDFDGIVTENGWKLQVMKIWNPTL